jgi:hypothetical protein
LFFWITKSKNTPDDDHHGSCEVMLDVIKHGHAIKTYPLTMEVLASILSALTSWRMRI